MHTALLCVYLDQTEFFPNPFDEVVQAKDVQRARYGFRPEDKYDHSLQPELTADHHGVVFSCEAVHPF